MRHFKLTAICLSMALALTACASDDTDDGGDGDAATTEEDTESDDDMESEDAAGPTVEVVTTDYAFDMPAEVEAGTTLTLRNDSEAEAHEILAFLIPEDDDRAVGDIAAEGEAGMAGLELRGVAVAAPGETATEGPLGPVVMAEPGRYFVACFLPTGAPPDEIFAAIEEFVAAGAPEDGAPEYPETGPPHAANGMITELTVTG